MLFRRPFRAQLPIRVYLGFRRSGSTLGYIPAAASRLRSAQFSYSYPQSTPGLASRADINPEFCAQLPTLHAILTILFRKQDCGVDPCSETTR